MTSSPAPADIPAKDEEAPQQPLNVTSNHRLQQSQMQVQELTGIMNVNLDKILKRDQDLSKLDDQADALKDKASHFETSAAKLKRKYWWKNLKRLGPVHSAGRVTSRGGRGIRCNDVTELVAQHVELCMPRPFYAVVTESYKIYNIK
ncbi:hypothetical protein Z043_109689 [Scleropages formosus]|uniref:V-SNARE coiled-coil homology domain-containing protein n=1 Tax=Scleropages formosus TaxID=113540 RepID=A0A0P7X9U4_SCLFO|nr:hypothetical protein Z043_109689 [Scleropages formosus]